MKEYYRITKDGVFMDYILYSSMEKAQEALINLKKSLIQKDLKQGYNIENIDYAYELTSSTELIERHYDQWFRYRITKWDFPKYTII